jgi:hypothetical protein
MDIFYWEKVSDSPDLRFCLSRADISELTVSLSVREQSCSLSGDVLLEQLRERFLRDGVDATPEEVLQAIASLCSIRGESELPNA